jgi:hypothetical protein
MKILKEQNVISLKLTKEELNALSLLETINPCEAGCAIPEYQDDQAVSCVSCSFEKNLRSAFGKMEVIIQGCKNES